MTTVYKCPDCGNTPDEVCASATNVIVCYRCDLTSVLTPIDDEDADFDYVMSVCEEFNKTDASDKYVGDIGDGMDQDGKMSLCLALNTSKGDGFGFQVGFERVNGIWTLIVWETLVNRCDGVTVEAYASNATGSDNAKTVAAELARLIEMIATK